MRILGIAGSLRGDSHNRRLLRAAAALLPPGAEFEELDPSAIKSLPVFDEDDEAQPGPAVEALRAKVADADGILFVTPEYNGTIPGGLKNAIDWLSRPAGSAALHNVPAAVIGGSTGMFGAVWAQADLRKALGLAGARVIDRELPVATIDETLHHDGTFEERDLQLELMSILGELGEAVEHHLEHRKAA